MRGSPEPVCIVCGALREPRKREACGARCRAALSRARKAEAQVEREAEVLAVVYRGERLSVQAQALLTECLEVVGEFERLGGRLRRSRIVRRLVVEVS